MKKLILTRHAKSSWDNPLIGDHARVLNDRGRKNARAMGAWLKAHGHLPDQVICSTAERCVQSWEIIGLEMESTANMTYETGLYHSSSDQIAGYVRKAKGDTVMLLAHNPGIGDSAMRLATQAADHEAFYRYPTCATTVFTFDIASWDKLEFGAGTIIAFKIPREL
ncbi:MAG: histidine phosphatase family protein [Pseudomonadota bacterium]